jgi:hypothetical protein
MTGTKTPEPIFVDTSVEFHAHARVENGDVLAATQAAYTSAAYRVLANNRTAVQVEVIVRVAP